MMVRAFIAVEIPAEIQRALARSLAHLQEALPKPLVSWITHQNVHLTLKFLGDSSAANLKRLVEALVLETVTHQSFSMSVGGLGAFPSPSRARIIWVGIAAPPALIDLWRSIEDISARLGYLREHRPFSPHLTVGRVGNNISGTDLQRIRTALKGTAVGSLGNFHVDAVQIFKSDLQPGGAVYTRLFTLPMKST
jgi:2'-5' RNA ligase